MSEPANSKRLGNVHWRRVFLISHFSLLIFFLLSCSPKPSTKVETPQGFGESRAADLQVIPKQAEMTVEWDKTVTAQVDVTWLGGQKYPVQITPAAGTPSWL